MEQRATIPVYRVAAPEYVVPRIRRGSRTQQPTASWHGVPVPKAYEERKPDFAAIGAKIDRSLIRHFAGRSVAVRALGSQEHKGMTVDALIATIKRLGHDRYDASKRGDRYENLDGKPIDLFALDFTVRADGRYFERFLEPFYFWPIVDRGEPVRIDVAIVYDRRKLRRVIHRYEGRDDERKRDGFVFRYPDRKADAILGIIRIL